MTTYHYMPNQSNIIIRPYGKNNYGNTTMYPSTVDGTLEREDEDIGTFDDFDRYNEELWELEELPQLLYCIEANANQSPYSIYPNEDMAHYEKRFMDMTGVSEDDLLDMEIFLTQLVV